MAESNIPQHCATCSEVVTLLKAAVAVMSTNTHKSTELADLLAEVARLAASQQQSHKHVPSDSLATPSNLPVTEELSITGDGSGAGSPEVYREMAARVWTGRLGRTHMTEVDRMIEATKRELDCYLRRTIHKIVPVGGGYGSLNPDTIFAALAVFGLRLEDRGPMADVTIFDDDSNRHKSPLSRMRNFGALYYRRGENYDSYWKGSAMETLIELARYRGLFNNEGFLNV